MSDLDTINQAIVLQVNGIMKGKIPIIPQETRAETIERAREELGLATEPQTVFIPKRLVNFIIY